MNPWKRSAWYGAAALLVFGQATLAWAEKPEWAGHGGGRDKEKHQRKHESHEPREQERLGRHERYDAGLPAAVVRGAFFGDMQRRAVHDFYAPSVAAGKCPPGLAKKGNGCLPPGQAKKWAVGRALPAGVTTYPLPLDLRRRLGPPPPGHDFVRVAGDILLIAVGTGMVIDAIEDLTR